MSIFLARGTRSDRLSSLMLTSAMMLSLSRRTSQAITKYEADIITTNMLAILGLSLLSYILTIRSLIPDFLPSHWISLGSIVRFVLLFFSLNVIGSVLRISRKIFIRVEEEPYKAKTEKASPKPVGPKFLIKDPVIYRPEAAAPLRSHSMLNVGGFRSASGLNRTMSFAAEPTGTATATATINNYAGGGKVQVGGQYCTPGPLQQRSLPGSIGKPGGLISDLAFKILASPAPPGLPGTPVAADDLSRRLPAWTDKLIDSLNIPDASEVTKQTSESVTAASVTAVEQPAKARVIERRILSPEESLAEIGLGLHIDQITENLRGWLSRKILKPLAADINETVESFGNNGMDHLNPFHPASFSSSMFGSTTAAAAPIMKNVISITPLNVTQPQSLMDLAQRMKDDPIVRKRLRIEKYLAFANLATRRSFVIGRILAMAKGNLLAAFSPAQGLDSDTEILLSLFCTFMDEMMPSADFYDGQPFSSKHFIRIGEKPSLRPDAIQIAQTSAQTFELVADALVFRSHPGPSNLFHCIAFMVEYIHGHREGFLGIANIGSRDIDLLSIFNV